MIIYPAIDLRHGRCVRLQQGDPSAETVFGDDPAQIAARWAAYGAEWLHLVNLDGAFGDQAGAGQNVAALKKVIQSVDVPIQFGGGLRAMEDIQAAIDLGVSRVIIGTAALKNPDLVRDAVEKLGSDRVALGLDVRGDRVATHGWQKLSETSAIDLAAQMKKMGIGRVIFTDISRDGMLVGVNAAACADLAHRTGLGVIASGGVASIQDVEQVKSVEHMGVEGIIIGKALYTGDVDLQEALQIAGTKRAD